MNEWKAREPSEITGAAEPSVEDEILEALAAFTDALEKQADGRRMAAPSEPEA